MKSTWLSLDSHNVICDVCGFKFKASELKLRYDGMLVCEDDWEARHPSEFGQQLVEDTSVPWTRPKATEGFVDVTYTTGGTIPTEE